MDSNALQNLENFLKMGETLKEQLTGDFLKDIEKEIDKEGLSEDQKVQLQKQKKEFESKISDISVGFDGAKKDFARMQNELHNFRMDVMK